MIGTLLLWIFRGLWPAFCVGLLAALICGVELMRYYMRHAAYICPQCHKVFQPGVGAMMFSAHTPKTRKLTCPGCGKTSYCLETYHE